MLTSSVSGLDLLPRTVLFHRGLVKISTPLTLCVLHDQWSTSAQPSLREPQGGSPAQTSCAGAAPALLPNRQHLESRIRPRHLAAPREPTARRHTCQANLRAPRPHTSTRVTRRPLPHAQHQPHHSTQLLPVHTPRPPPSPVWPKSCPRVHQSASNSSLSWSAAHRH